MSCRYKKSKSRIKRERIEKILETIKTIWDVIFIFTMMFGFIGLLHFIGIV